MQGAIEVSGVSPPEGNLPDGSISFRQGHGTADPESFLILLYLYMFAADLSLVSNML